MRAQNGFRLLVASVLGLLLAACGIPGAPLPPSLRLPRPAGDLVVSRQGDRVRLAWTVPVRTTDGQRVERLGGTRICRSLTHPRMEQCDEVVASIPPDKLTPGEQTSYTDMLSFELQAQHATQMAAYGVETLNRNGRSAGLSNQARVPLAPTIAPPQDFSAKSVPEGVQLTWTGVPHPHESPRLSHLFRIYRSAPGSQQRIALAEVRLEADPSAVYVDQNVEWEQAYSYQVLVVTRLASENGQLLAEIEGDPGPPVSITPHDTFPPPTPRQVQAVYSEVGDQRFLDLTWDPSAARDLAGYNVYRREPGGEATRVNREPVLTPTFRDPHIVPGKQYLYSVSAVDVRGNESVRSAEASEVVPLP